MTGAAAAAGREIRLIGVSKRWEAAQALADVNIDIPAGSFTALLGPSGCGKSTLLRVVAGLESASAGQVMIGARDVSALPADRRDLSMVFQSYALFPHLDVAENITFGLRTRRVPKAERQQRLDRVAALLGLEDYLHRKPAQLSGGQQQRVALGRAVIGERSVCLMDEPLSNLDAKLRQTMRTELRALQRQMGFTMLYVTHDQVEAITMADQVVLMNGGRVEQVADPHTLYERPETTFAARFIGTPPMNLLPAADLAELGAVLEARAGLRLTIGLRPEALHRTAQSPLNLAVTGIEYLGSDALLHGRIGAAAVIMRVPGRDLPQAGGRIPLALAPQDLHLFDADSGRRIDLPDVASSLSRAGIPAGPTGAQAPSLYPEDT